jgi:hypothetical protein
MCNFVAGNKMLNITTDIEAHILNNLVDYNRTFSNNVVAVSSFDLFKEQIEGLSDLIGLGIRFRWGEIP